MQKIKMSRGVTLTFEEGCKKYLENCRQRNLRDLITTIHFFMNKGWLPHFVAFSKSSAKG